MIINSVVRLLKKNLRKGSFWRSLEASTDPGGKSAPRQQPQISTKWNLSVGWAAQQGCHFEAATAWWGSDSGCTDIVDLMSCEAANSFSKMRRQSSFRLLKNTSIQDVSTFINSEDVLLPNFMYKDFDTLQRLYSIINRETQVTAGYWLLHS